MAVYEMSRRAIAEYLSDTRNEFALGCNPSGEGHRMNKYGDTYPVRVIDIEAVHEITPKVDCFLNRDESITVRVYLPKYTYFAVTKELHKAYGPNEGLRFGFTAEPRTFEYTLPKNEVNSYNDFKEPMEDLIRRISEKMKNDINQFHAKDDWTIVGITVDVTFKIHSTNTK